MVHSIHVSQSKFRATNQLNFNLLYTTYMHFNQISIHLHRQQIDSSSNKNNSIKKGTLHKRLLIVFVCYGFMQSIFFPGFVVIVKTWLYHLNFWLIWIAKFFFCDTIDFLLKTFNWLHWLYALTLYEKKNLW